jgi:Glycine cleavage system T protein (aminomethyltransferase)
MAVQGPKSFKLMEKVFGEKIKKLKFFDFDYFDFKGTKHLIAQSGWSKQGGYEIYVENTNSGLELYDHLFDAGKELDVKPGCPNIIERIESALLSYGNDMDNNDNPFECGFDKYISLDTQTIFLGKDNLKKIQSEGINRKLMGVQINATAIDVSGSMDLKDENNNKIGELRSGCYSPHFAKVIGIAMIKKPFWEVSQTIKIEINKQTFDGKVCDLPFI